AEYGRAEEQSKVFVDFPTIGLDTAAMPLCAQAKLIPCAYVIRSAFVLGAEHGFELRHGKLPDRVARVYKNHVSVIEKIHIAATGGDLKAGGRIALCALE